jgi:hypothetical protein
MLLILNLPLEYFNNFTTTTSTTYYQEKLLEVFN